MNCFSPYGFMAGKRGFVVISAWFRGRISEGVCFWGKFVLSPGRFENRNHSRRFSGYFGTRFFGDLVPPQKTNFLIQL